LRLVVATRGRASTPIHVQKLLRQTDTVIFSFDGDAAGRRAARRALDASLPHAGDNKTIRFLFLPTEHDPDSYIRELGTEAFEQQVNDAMPLSQFLLREVTAEQDLATPEGRARAQFEAKPLLQAMPPSSLRLQIVRSLAQATQSTPSEIEALFELAQPVARARKAPPPLRRNAPVGLERQILRLLVAHPTLVAELDDGALDALAYVAPESVEMFAQLLTTAAQMGEGASFAALSELLRTAGSDFEPLIAEIAAEAGSDLALARAELAGAIRQTKMKMITAELKRLSGTGLPDEEAKLLFRELMLQQAVLRKEADDEAGRGKDG
jgi:DNA primase